MAILVYQTNEIKKSLILLCFLPSLIVFLLLYFFLYSKLKLIYFVLLFICFLFVQLQSFFVWSDALPGQWPADGHPIHPDPAPFFLSFHKKRTAAPTKTSRIPAINKSSIAAPFPYMNPLSLLYDVRVNSPLLWYLRIVPHFVLPQSHKIFAYHRTGVLYIFLTTGCPNSAWIRFFVL